MARWSNATLVALGGFDKNVVIDELLYGEDNYYDINFAQDTERTVLQVSGAIVTITGGDTTPFSAGTYVTFGNSALIYEIASVGSNTITLTTAPNPVPFNAEAIQIPIDLTSATFQFRLLRHTATISDNTTSQAINARSAAGGGGAVIGNIVTYEGATELNLDANVITTTPGLNLTLGQIRVLLNGNQLVTGEPPVIDTFQPPLYLGYLGVTFPPPDIVTPSQKKKQRMAFIVRTDGIIN
jgi:hypothetical protein